MINGKNKGSSFERNIAKKLTQWSGHEFNRTPMSGGLRWKEDNSVVGDIVPPPTLNFPFSIEIKKHEIPWDFDFILKGTSDVWKFWEQSSEDCERLHSNTGEHKHPMVVFSKNYRSIYALSQIEYIQKVIDYSGVDYIVVNKSGLKLALFDFMDMLNNCPFSVMMDLYKST